LPPNVVAGGEDATWVIVVDDRAAATKDRVLRIVPRTLVVGVGSTRGASATSVGAALSELDAQGGLDLRAIKAFATADVKADEPGIVDAVEDWGFWHGDTAELLTFPTEELAEIGVPNPSSVVRNSMGTASVAEAAALRGARSIGHGGPIELAAEKFKRDNVTVAAARVLPRGAKEAIARRMGLHELPPDVIARFHRKYEIWRAKWGFHPLNPDMDEVFARYGGTEVCWRHDDALRQAGERIVDAASAAR
jgi:hypothetical protein